MTFSSSGSGRLLFRKGYYVSVDSVHSGLTRRLQSALRKPAAARVGGGGVLETLKAAADSRQIIPIRTAEPLEAELASAIARVADWTLSTAEFPGEPAPPRFFGMTDPPLTRRAFVELLLDFRINRLEKHLS